MLPLAVSAVVMPAGEPIMRPAPDESVKLPAPLRVLVPMLSVAPLFTVKAMRPEIVPPDVTAWGVRLPLTFVPAAARFQSPPGEATLIVRLPQLRLGRATGAVPPLAHFWNSMVLDAPSVRVVEPGMSAVVPLLEPLAAL